MGGAVNLFKIVFLLFDFLIRKDYGDSQESKEKKTKT